MAAQARLSWKMTHGTVRGASHERAGTGNQDFIAGRTADGDHAPVVLAVADGHGSPRSFRSARGAEFAVRIALEATSGLLQAHAADPAGYLDRLARDAKRLPADIVVAWRRSIHKDWMDHPLTPDEQAWVPAAAEGTVLEAVGAEPPWLPTAYGATLLIAAIGDGFAFYLQLGDGDILVATAGADDGEIAVWHPLPTDKTLIANETTSLCLPRAQGLFRFRFQNFQDRPPILVLLSTDGYANSFRSLDDFEQVGSDLVQMIAQRGWEHVCEDLNAWLDEASRSGSGDDVSLGMLYCPDALARLGRAAPEDAPPAGPEVQAPPPATTEEEP